MLLHLTAFYYRYKTDDWDSFECCLILILPHRFYQSQLMRLVCTTPYFEEGLAIHFLFGISIDFCEIISGDLKTQLLNCSYYNIK